MSVVPSYFTRDAGIEALRQARDVDLPGRRRYSGTAERADWLERRKLFELAGARCLGADLSWRKHAAPDGVRRTWYVEKSARTMLEGVCATAHVIHDEWAVDPAGMELEAGLPVPLLWRHDETKQVGEVVWLRRTPGAIFLRATVFDNEIHVRDAVDAGELACLSVGVTSLETERRADGIDHFKRWRLHEASLVMRGGNPEARCWPWTAPNRRSVKLL